MEIYQVRKTSFDGNFERHSIKAETPLQALAIVAGADATGMRVTSTDPWTRCSATSKTAIYGVELIMREVAA